MSSSRINVLLALGALLVTGPLCLTAQEKAGGAARAATRALIGSAPLPDELMTALAAEQQMLAEATHRAALGDITGAWQVLVADFDGQPGKSGLRTDRIGWRAATVSGFLRNQSSPAEAYALARFALTQPWCQGGALSDDARYWAATVALDGTGDRKAALEWIGIARTNETPRLHEIRGRLEKIENAFRTQD